MAGVDCVEGRASDMPSASTLRVLIVDDQMSMRGIARYCLQEIGIKNVVEAKSGAEALVAIGSNKFDLIISDWNMDGMDGLTLLKTIRSNPLTKRMPFIMATGQRDTEMVKTAIQAGVNNYMVKPFNAATMKQKIESVIGKLGA
jgi:two-component system, chemotaxis family, chemotaxis protein CheY